LLLLLYALIGIAAATTAVTLAGFNVDLFLAGLFYDPAADRFIGQTSRTAAMLRDHGFVAVSTCIGIVTLASTRFLPWRLPSVRRRTAIFLTLSLLLGPGLLVNGILKEHWGRPRPIDVVQFGGAKAYADWWQPDGACERNCSFVSGEGATAAWMFGPAMIVPAPWRGLALAAAAAFTAAMGGLRMAAGAHFFTDVVFGALSTILILLAMRALTDRRLGPALDSLVRRKRAGGGADSSRAQPTA
jgi:membrane-associated phospholipid phosphatase